MITSRCYQVLLVAASLATGSFVAAQTAAPSGADSSSASTERTMAKQAIDREDSDQAVACANRAVAMAPGDAECQHVLGIAYSMAAHQANVFHRFLLARKSGAAFRQAVALAPNNADYHQSLFEYYEQTPMPLGGGFQRASTEAAAVKRLDSARGALDYAMLYTSKKEFDQARAQLEEVFRATPDDVCALYQTGRIAALSGQYLDRGLAALKLCLAKSPSPEEGAPSPAEVDLRIGNILEKKGDKDGAREAYIKALAYNPKFAPAFEALKKVNG